jgi:two-component system, sensor histidine kinase
MKPPHVLVVDDEGNLRAALNMLLSMEGFQVTEAPGGEHALELVSAGLRPDLLLLDYRMPGLNGGQTLERIRAQALDAPAVLLTAASGAHDLARQHGFDAVLQKPVGPDVLVATLRKLLPAK